MPGYEAFLLVTLIPATATWVNAFITHFLSKPALGAEELDTAPRTQVKVNIVRRGFPLVSNAQPPPTQLPSDGGAPVVAMRHEALSSRGLFRKIRKISKEPGWSWTQLCAAEADLFPKVNRDLSNVKLLAQLCALLLNNRKSLVTDHKQAPPPCEVSLAIGVYGDGYPPRGRPNVNMKFALIDQSGQLFRTCLVVVTSPAAHPC